MQSVSAFLDDIWLKTQTVRGRYSWTFTRLIHINPEHVAKANSAYYPQRDGREMRVESVECRLRSEDLRGWLHHAARTSDSLFALCGCTYHQPM